MREQKTYEIVLHVGSLNLTTVLDVVKDCATIASVKQLTITTKKAHTFTGGKRLKGISAKALVLEVLADGQIHSIDDLSKVFVARGFAAGSYSSACSYLVQEGQIKQVTRGRFCLATVTHIQPGGAK